MIRIASARPVRGFTMVELMVTVMIAAILTAIAVPNFRNLILSNRLTTTANEAVDALNAARMEAVKLNAPVQFCSNDSGTNGSDTLGAKCGTDATAIYGMLENGTTTPTPTRVRAGVPGLVQQTTSDVVLSNGGKIAAVRYAGDGVAYAPGSSSPMGSGSATGTTVADLCIAALKSDNHRVITITAGSVLATTTKTGACP